MNWLDRHRCEHCRQFMLLVGGLLPLHADDEGRMCAGSDSEDWEEPMECSCAVRNNPPCGACESGYVDVRDAEPGPLLCEQVKTANRCGIWCPLLARGECLTPEVVLALAPERAADAPPIDLFELDAEPMEPDTPARDTEPTWITRRRAAHRLLRAGIGEEVGRAE